MPRKNTQIEGQITLADFSADLNYLVCQHNDLILARQSLSLNACRLIRAVIMQIKPDDDKLRPYAITIPELADIFGVDSSNLYRQVEGIITELQTSLLEIQDNEGNWIKYSWVSFCGYDKKKGIVIKLNDDLKPYLINLKNNYSRYPGLSLKGVRGVYTFRFFEVMLAHLMFTAKQPADIYISIGTIRTALNCTDKFLQIGQLKEKVIEPAIREINSRGDYLITHDYIKQNKTIVKIHLRVHILKEIKKSKKLTKANTPDDKDIEC